MPYRLAIPQRCIMASQEGFEPPTHGLEGRCSIQLSYWLISCFMFLMERVKGIEPSRLAWKARALPLSYTRKMERKTRFELATLALARRCSTTEPLSHVIGGGDWIRTSESVANGFTVRPLWPTREPLHIR